MAPLLPLESNVRTERLKSLRGFDVSPISDVLLDQSSGMAGGCVAGDDSDECRDSGGWFLCDQPVSVVACELQPRADLDPGHAGFAVAAGWADLTREGVRPAHAAKAGLGKPLGKPSVVGLLQQVFNTDNSLKFR